MERLRNQESGTNAPPGHDEIDEGASVSPQTPGSQSLGEPFPAGAEVEVRISSEGFYDSWYEAMVLSYYRVTRHSRYKVQYNEILRDDGSGEKLVEDVPAKNVRPRAPRRFSSHGPSFSLPSYEDEDPEIKMHDLVEAFHNDGWWHGVISGLKNPDTGLYTVSFPNSREVFQFKPADIRTQSTFANGKWFRVLNVQQKTEAYKEGDKVEMYRERDDYGPSFFPARVEKVIHLSYYLVKYESPDAHPNSDLTEILDPQHLRPDVDCMPGTNFFMVDSHVEVFIEGGWSAGVVSRRLSGLDYVVTMESKSKSMTVHVSNMRLRLEWNGKRWRKWDSPSMGKKRKSASSGEIFSSDVSLTESESTPDGTFPGKKVKRARKEGLGSDYQVPVSKSSRVKPESSKGSSNSSRIMRAVRKVSQSPKLLTELKECHSKISTSKRSSTCKRKLNGSATYKKQDKVDNNRQAASEIQNDVNLSNESSSDVLQPSTNGEKERAHVGMPSCEQNLLFKAQPMTLKASNTNCAADFAGENSVCVSPHDRTVGHIADSEGQSLLSTQEDSQTNGVTKIHEGQLVDSLLLNSSATLEHLTGSQENISSPGPSRLIPSVDPAAPLPILENSVSTDPNPNSELSKHTLAEHIPVKPVTCDIVLPFEKISPLWKSLETTLEVFSHIPQSPHFKKLESECKERREGTAIGMMVTYANLAESVHRLSIHTDVTIFEEKIGCLDSLEENGFIVDPIRSRLQYLFEMKTNCLRSALRQVELETELANKKQANEDSLASANACEAKLAGIRKSIAVLKEQLSVMEQQEKAAMEERARLSGLAVKHDRYISRLEDEIIRINKSDELASEEFGRLVLETLY